MEVIGAGDVADEMDGDTPRHEDGQDRTGEPLAHVDIYTVNAGRNGEGSIEAPVFSRDQLPVDTPIEGPCNHHRGEQHYCDRTGLVRAFDRA